VFNRLSLLTLVIFLTNNQAWGMLKTLPADFIKIIPGKTAGFNHQKFLALRNQTITEINQKVIQLLHKIVSSNKAYSYKDYDLKNPEVLRKIGQHFPMEEAPKPDVSTCGVGIDPATYTLIANCLKRNGVNPNDVFVIIDNDELDEAAMSTLCITNNPKLHYLGIRNDIYQKVKQIVSKPTIPGRISTIAERMPIVGKQTFETYLVHEASHIRHLDCPMRAMLHINQCPEELSVEMVKIYEERADTHSVFDGPNPLFQSFSLQNKIAGDNYAHRQKPKWQLQSEQIKSCYSEQLIASSMGLMEHIYE
jgi:hypothetical protein